MTIQEFLERYWHLVTMAGLFVAAWVETRGKVKNLLEWKTAMEVHREEQARQMQAIMLDIREIKTVLRIKEQKEQGVE